jgi:hypothetical protein
VLEDVIYTWLGSSEREDGLERKSSKLKKFEKEKKKERKKIKL